MGASLYFEAGKDDARSIAVCVAPMTWRDTTCTCACWRHGAFRRGSLISSSSTTTGGTLRQAVKNRGLDSSFRVFYDQPVLEAVQVSSKIVRNPFRRPWLALCIAVGFNLCFNFDCILHDKEQSPFSHSPIVELFLPENYISAFRQSCVPGLAPGLGADECAR